MKKDWIKAALGADVKPVTESRIVLRSLVRQVIGEDEGVSPSVTNAAPRPVGAEELKREDDDPDGEEEPLPLPAPTKTKV